MCLAVPMKVLEIEGDQDDFLSPPVAVVEAQGTRATVRLDIVDRFPTPGDYVIVHAGFAIHTLTEEEAMKSLGLLADMAENG
ncbi:MAG: HypC/HybG/HupF family hydrogenase formation chaperone [Thermodesulfobacteria bacterium]|nr:HypC/HybG/HupF family hydrogenase formation chaperone [Thermodesulfobacteriota bacterium]